MPGIIGMPQQLIIGMPEHISEHGVPLLIMLVSIAHISFIISMVLPSPGVITHFIPLSVMEHAMRQAMGIIMGTGIDMGTGVAGIMLMGGIIGVCIRAAVVITTLRSAGPHNSRHYHYNRRASPFNLSMLLRPTSNITDVMTQ